MKRIQPAAARTLPAFPMAAPAQATPEDKASIGTAPPQRLRAGIAVVSLAAAV